MVDDRFEEAQVCIQYKKYLVHVFGLFCFQGCKMDAGLHEYHEYPVGKQSRTLEAGDEAGAVHIRHSGQAITSH